MTTVYDDDIYLSARPKATLENTPSIFNDVIGPVMRGPSSSHCAAALRIGRMARDLMGGELQRMYAFNTIPTAHWPPPTRARDPTWASVADCWAGTRTMPVWSHRQ
jgi:hypothetical protein